MSRSEADRSQLLSNYLCMHHMVRVSLGCKVLEQQLWAGAVAGAHMHELGFRAVVSLDSQAVL